jgi:hypothetical protein
MQISGIYHHVHLLLVASVIRNKSRIFFIQFLSLVIVLISNSFGVLSKDTIWMSYPIAREESSPIHEIFEIR